MEKLGRGVVALRTSSTQVYVGWRLLATDPDTIGFNLYRTANGAAPVKLNTLPLTNTTDYVDTGATLSISNAWFVRPVTNGVESPSSVPFGLNSNAPVRQYLSVPLHAVTGGAYPPYDVKFGWVGDLDGDGEYDYVVDRISTITNGNEYLQAYKRDGTFLWQMDMGYNSTNQYNIEPGASAISIGDKDNVTVYDMDGDGRAEVMVRTARGVVLPDGTVVSGPDDTTQYLSVLDGLTGKLLASTTLTNPYFSDGPLNCHFGIMYCDGIHPSLLVEGENRHGSGAFQRFTGAWDYRNGQLTQRWYWTPPATGYARAHQIRIADVNHDGIDDLVEIGSVNSGVDGQPLFDTELGHGDRYHTTDMDPDHPGLETYAIQQLNPTLLATMLFEAGTGKIIKKWYAPDVVDVGRGDALDMDPRYKGVEVFSTQPGIYDCKGNTIPGATAPFPTLGIWWDADLCREMLSAPDGNGFSPVINKWNYTNSSADRMYSIYSEGVHTAYGGRPAFFGDILGDWREEVVVVANDYSEIRIYSTTIQATNRLYCLMQNPEYRDQCTCKGYYQESFPDYYLGMGMQPPPIPPVSDAKLVWRGGGLNAWDAGGTANWFTNNLWISNNAAVAFNDGDTVLFDLSGSNSVAVNLSGALAPGAVTVHSPKDYAFAGAGSLTGGMQLTKAGAGRLTFNNTNAFTGRTLVCEGSLIIDGELTASPVTVRGGVWLDGRLAGVGRVGGGVSLQPGGGVSPGNGTNSPGTLTVSNSLLMAGGTLNDFDLSDNLAGPTNDLLNVFGNLTLQGTNTLVIHRLNATLPTGAYPLINYTGALTGGISNLAVAGLDGIPLALTNPPGQIALIIKSVRAPSALTWAGGLNGNAWDLVTSSNWLNGASRDYFVPQDTVRFDNTGATNTAVTLSATLLAGGVTVDSSSNYVFGGSGGISGAGGLTKTNSGTLTISNDNSYTGRTIVGGGVLEVNDLSVANQPGPLGSAPNTSPTNLVLGNGATWRFPGAQAYTDRGFTLQSGTSTVEVATSGVLINVSGQIVGGGALLKTGPGTLILGASNTFSGGAIINAGALQLATEDANTYGVGSGLVTLNGGVLKMLDDSSTYSKAYYNIYVPAGSTGELDADSRIDCYGALTGGGTLNYYVPYVRTTLYGKWSAFTGQINIYPGTGGDSRVTGNGTSGDFRISNSYGYANAAIFLYTGINAYHTTSGAAVTIGELSGTNSSTLSAAAWTVGAKNTDATFGGNILGSSITKIGSGTWTLTGTNTYSGQTTISAGSVQIGNGGVTGTLGTNNVANNAVLIFNRSDSIADSGLISGSGSVIKRGSGKLTLSRSHTYSGATTVEAGTLALTNAGSIANSVNINVAAGAFLDARSRADGTLTLASGQTLGGNGAVLGNVIVGSGAKVAPGNSAGALTFSNSLTLLAGSSTIMEVSKSPLTNDLVRVATNLTCGGTLIITNIGGTALAAGDSFTLFAFRSAAGAFAAIVPPYPGPGLRWDTNSLTSSGAVKVVKAPLPGMSAATLAGPSVVITGTGETNGAYYVLTSTNLAQPATQWTRIATNQFDAAGRFNFTNAINSTLTQQFFRLQIP
jgi:autotransporter-associated beta strand protein